MVGQRKHVDEARRLCEELCDMTKESSTKFDLKNKLASVDAPFTEVEKKIGQ